MTSVLPSFHNFHIPFAIPLAMIILLPAFNQATVRILVGTCHASRYIESKGGSCSVPDAASCCQAGMTYAQYYCSPPVTGATPAIMHSFSFANVTTKCQNKTYTDDDAVVTLSTGWYDCGSRCMRNVTINGNNGNSVTAQVVGECDSVHGCDVKAGNSPPCAENYVMASPAVWDQLGVPESQSNELDITWSDADAVDQ